MTSWIALLFLLLVLFAITAVAAALARPGPESAGPESVGAAGTPAWRVLLNKTSRSLIVLLLSGAWFYSVFRWVHWDAARSLWIKGTKAWIVLWAVLLAMAFGEALGVLAFRARGKPFPVPPLLRNIVRGLVSLAVVFGLLKYSLGVNISPLLASTALLTAVVGFALQGVLGNLMAGMSLHLVRSVVPGDWVRIDDVEGQVVEMNWRETRLRTNAGHCLILPNSRVAGAQIHNMTYPDRRRRHEMIIPIRCNVPPEIVTAELAAAAAAVPMVLKQPAPSAHILGFKDYGVEYRLRFWSERYFNRAPIEGDVARMVWYRLRRKGIELPLPVADEWIARVREMWARPETAALQDARRIVEELKRSELMSKWLVDAKGEPLIGHADLERLAEHVRRVRFATGEVVFRQGDPGAACYVVLSGRLRGTMEFNDMPEPASFVVESGALVGEMSLVTQLPRTATLVAEEEVEMLEIPESAFQRLLALRPDVPERLAAVVAERARNNEATLQRLKSVAAEPVQQRISRKSILDRLLSLLGRAG